jgi:hypothetical protein
MQWRSRCFVLLLLLLGTAGQPGIAAGQAARGVVPVVLTGARLPAWSQLAAVTAWAP